MSVTPAHADIRAGSAAPPARDGEIAIREEFRAAQVAGTRAALELFIRRHPDHALADRARDLLEQMERERLMSEDERSRPIPGPRDGEIAVREEFAHAILAGGAAALELFIRRHPTHPLAEIAALMLERGLVGTTDDRHEYREERD